MRDVTVSQIALAVVLALAAPASASDDTLRAITSTDTTVMFGGSNVQKNGKNLVYSTVLVMEPPQAIKEGQPPAQWLINVWSVNCRSRKLETWGFKSFTPDNALIENFKAVQPYELDALSRVHVSYICDGELQPPFDKMPALHPKVAIQTAVESLRSKSVAP